MDKCNGREKQRRKCETKAFGDYLKRSVNKEKKKIEKINQHGEGGDGFDLDSQNDRTKKSRRKTSIMEDIKRKMEGNIAQAWMIVCDIVCDFKELSKSFLRQ